MAGTNGEQTEQQPPSTNSETRTLIDEAQKAVRGEFLKKFAGGLIAGVLGLLGLAALGGWGLLKDPVIRAVGGVPAGAVVAFDRANCPEGWTLLDSTISRVIVGAAPSEATDVVSNKDVNGKQLKARHYPEDGGEEAHTLISAEVPKHKQLTIDWVPGIPPSESAWGTPKTGSFQTVQTFQENTEGEGKSFSMMPPFKALFYCKKG
jgi:hypothetical protein